MIQNYDEDREIIEHYIRTAEMLGKMFKPFLEVIVHDLKKPDQAIIAIFNGNITGRKIGDPTTDLGLKRLNNDVPDCIVNYTNMTESGVRLKSSSLVIRNKLNQVIGSLCLNFNVEPFHDFQSIMKDFLLVSNNPFIDEQEQFNTKEVNVDIEHSIKNYLTENAIKATNITKDHKMKIVQMLHKEGQFNKKSSVRLTAEILGVSKPTIYKYLNLAMKQ